jgi:predicted membrane protein
MASPESSEAEYKPVDAIQAGVEGAITCGTFGLVASAVVNALARQNVGAMGVFTRTGGLILIYGALLSHVAFRPFSMHLEIN